VSRILAFWRSTLGKKVVMGVTGLIMIVWLVLHMAGNLQAFAGAEKLNGYAALLHGPAHELLLLSRVILLAALILHVIAATQLTVMSRKARPVQYAKKVPQASTVASQTLRWGGVLILVFLVYHLSHFTWGTAHPDFVQGNVYHNLVVGFRDPLIVVFYLIALIAVGLHVYHGTWASLRSLGVARPSPNPRHRPIALVIALIVWLGMSVIPVAVWFGWLK
jgi:succinate dehydrogenase / fumarate reductase cytochrome b subunit